MEGNRIETPRGSTGDKYLDGMAGVLMGHRLIRGTQGSYTLMCSGGHQIAGWCGACLAGRTPREIVDLMAAYGWGIIPGVMGSAPRVVCREHTK